MTQVQPNVFGRFAASEIAAGRPGTGSGEDAPGFPGAAASRPDGIARACRGPATTTLTPGAPAASGSGIFGVFASLIAGLDRTLDALSSYLDALTGEQTAEGSPSQNVRNATFSSVGDPHLAERGQVLDGSGNAHEIDMRFDSMAGHDNLVGSQDFDGGYRVSTTVTPANAAGITRNQSATVHTNADRDRVTMNDDGSVAISNNGTSMTLQTGQSVTLTGGELVTRSADGSLTVAQSNESDGSISTTLRATGGGVEVTASVRNAAVGGDIAGALPPSEYA